MNRLVILLFGIVSTVAVFILLILLYRYANQNAETVYTKKSEDRFLTNRTGTSEGTEKWLKDLAARKKPSYSYAVSEVEISLPLKKGSEPKSSFRLIIGSPDNYKMFCVRQILERRGIDFAVYKKADETVLIIHDIDKNEQNRIVQMARKYDVKTKIEKYVKD